MLGVFMQLLHIILHSVCLFVVFFMDHYVDHPKVLVTPFRNSKPIVGKSFQMQCNVNVTEGIIGSVDIIWKTNGTTKQRMNNTTRDMNSVHTDIFNISIVQLSDNNTVYHCEAVVNTITSLNGSGNFKLVLGEELAVYKTVITHYQYIANYVIYESH